MLNQIRSLAKSTAIYGIGNISSKLVGFLLLPFFTNELYLTVQAYGVLGLFEGIIQLFIMLFGMGISNILFRHYFDDPSKKRSLFFTSLLFVFLFATFGVFIGLAGEATFTSLLFDDQAFTQSYRWMILSASLQLMVVIPTSLMRLEDSPVLFTILSIIRLTTIFLATLGFLIWAKMGLEGIFIAQVLGHGIFLIAVTPYLVKNSAFAFDKRVPMSIIPYALPIMIASISGILIQFADRFIINSTDGLTEVGVYSLAVKLSNFVKIFVITTFNLSLTPLLYKKINEPDHKRFYYKSMTYYGFLILIVIIIVSLFSYEIINIFTASAVYTQALSIIPLLSLSLYFIAIKTVGVMGLHISKKMWYLTVVTFLILGINISLNLVLIPELGTIGAATATLLSQALYFVIIYFIAQQLYPIPFELGKIITMPILAIFLIYTGIYFNFVTPWIRIPLKSILVILFPILLYFGGFFEEIEKKRLFGMYKKWNNPTQIWANLIDFFK